ncbi:Hypothetical_protein [Hexamita inflata]|uniref:Hypothetical_protein n=1 Tax=Hexamita inflata TaxID=28002 RepID=A0AA86UD53_9EUKA|nr:Hypothetical protein HINF_LOCUS38639 [Hexamita inflata]
MLKQMNYQNYVWDLKASRSTHWLERCRGSRLLLQQLVDNFLPGPERLHQRTQDASLPRNLQKPQHKRGCSQDYKGVLDLISQKYLQRKTRLPVCLQIRPLQIFKVIIDNFCSEQLIINVQRRGYSYNVQSKQRRVIIIQQ